MYKGKRVQKKPTETKLAITSSLLDGLVSFLVLLLIELVKKYL